MKSDEIFNIGFVSLKEILKVDPFEWKWVSEFKAKFWNDDLELTIVLEPIKPYKLESTNQIIHPVNLTFGVEQDDGAIDTSPTNKGNLRKVLVTVAKAAVEKYKQLDKKYEIDTILLVSANDRKREKRSGIYGMAANEMWHQLSSLEFKELHFDRNEFNDYAIISKEKFTSEEVEDIKILVKKFEMNIRSEQ